MQVTSISWCDYTWNPITGCSYAGPECTNCFAERLSLEHGWSDSQWLPGNADENVTVHPNRLDEPNEFDYPDGFGRIFVYSMSDLFHPLVDEAVIEKVVATAREYPEHVWIFLTKRPERAAALGLDWPDNAWVGTSVGSGPSGEFPDTSRRIDALRDIDATTEPDASTRREMDEQWARAIHQAAREQDIPFYVELQNCLRGKTNRRRRN